jgi:hypothetical protein
MANFLDRLKEQVGAGITTVTTKSRVAVETARLRRQLGKVAQEKKAALAQLGAWVYEEMGQRGHVDPDGLRDAVARLQALDRAMEELRQETTRIAALEAVPPWPAGGGEQPLATCTCGAPLSAGSKFCGQCGAHVQEIVAKAAAGRCPRCGAENSPSAKFCRSCGAALTKGQEVPPQAEPKP